MLLLLLSRLSCALLFAAFHCAFEVFDRIAQAFAQIAQLARTKKDQCNDEYDKKFRNTKFSIKHCFAPSRNPRNSRAFRRLCVYFSEIVGPPQGRVKRNVEN